MADAAPSLAQLRAEIDRIDDELLALLDRRIAIGRRVAAAKGDLAGPYLRPGREAAILRRLIAQRSDDLPAPVIERIWREILGANLARQIDPRTVVFAPAGAESLVEIARDRGGVSTQVTIAESADAAIADVINGRATLAVLPDVADPRWRWWPLLLDTTRPNPKPRVIARLPFFETSPCPAFGVAAQDPDPSGDDITLYATRSPDAVPAGHQVLDSAEHASHRWALIAVDGYVDGDALPQGSVSIGAYARPYTH